MNPITHFLISWNVSSFDVGTGTVPDETPGNEFTIPLVSGWNLIGNPYLFDVAWSDIISYNNNPAQLNGQQPKKYSGSFQNANDTSGNPSLRP